MTAERLLAVAFPYIPQFCRGITSAGNERLTVIGHGQAHDVACVSGKTCCLLPCFYVPKATICGEEKRGADVEQ